MELQKNHALQGGKYRIIEKIGQGGFAITYKANWTTEVTGPMGKIATDIIVAIKEFFFADYCSRDNESSQITISSPTGAQIFDKFKEKLKKEAAILSRLRHPNIVSVLDIFEENNTVYMVMEYISGGSLKETIRKNGKLDENTALRYTSQLCDAVAEIHRNNVLHLDIKPGNILINNDDKVCLIDFGISKQYNSDTHAETSTTPVGISKGFAPTEQYSGVAQFSPATDIYAIGATIYNMCSGNIPPEAMTLLEEDLPPINGISDQLWNAITKAMSVRRNQRPQSIAELVALLPSANSAKESTTQQSVTDDEKTQITSQKPTPKPSIPSPTPKKIEQPKKTIASNDETMVESATRKDTYSPDPKYKFQSRHTRPKLTIIENSKINRKWHEYGSKFEFFLRYYIFVSIAISFIIFTCFSIGLGYTYEIRNAFEWSFFYSTLCIPIYLFCINFKLKELKYIKILSLISFISILLNIGIGCIETFIITYISTIITFILYFYWSKNNNKKGLLVWTKILLTVDLVYSLWDTLRLWM